jgi:hypothetical protein
MLARNSGDADDKGEKAAETTPNQAVDATRKHFLMD